MKVRTEKELANALKSNENEITIEGSLKDKTIRIKGTGTVAWVVALGAIGVAVIVALKTPIAIAGGPQATVAMGTIATASASAAVGILGLPTTMAAISISVVAKSTSVLKKLYNDYSIVSQGNNYVKLRKK